MFYLICMICNICTLLLSYVFMIGEKLVTQADAFQKDNSSASTGCYKVADQQDVTKFSKLFYQTGRLQGADKYIWISPFIRYGS